MLDKTMFAPNVLGPLVAEELNKQAAREGVPLHWQYDISDGLRFTLTVGIKK